jgi:hypothetical protein
MRRLSTATFLLLLPFTLYLLSGCGGSPSKKAPSTGGGAEDGDKEVPRTPLATMGTATLKGRVTLDGAVPEPPIIKALTEHKDCMDSPADQKIDRTWIVSKDHGVKNAVIWVQPPADKYFKLTDKEKTPKEKVVTLKQPHCEFIPHILVLFPGYFDGKDMVPTGQVLEVVNNAKFNHNTNIQGDQLVQGGELNKVLVKGEVWKPDLKPQKTPINVKCNIHPFMHAKIWALDNPFYTLTDDDGNYTIANVPAGAEVHVVAWHEGVRNGYALPEGKGASDGEAMTLEDGQTKTLNIKLKR